MVHGKVVDLIQGDSGTFCHYCDVSKSTENDLESIQLGFSITKSYEQVKEGWKMVTLLTMIMLGAGWLGDCFNPRLTIFKMI